MTELNWKPVRVANPQKYKYKWVLGNVQMASLVQTNRVTVNKKCEQLNYSRMRRSSYRTPLYKRANCGTLEGRMSEQHLFSFDHPHDFHSQEKRYLLHLSSHKTKSMLRSLNFRKTFYGIDSLRGEHPLLENVAPHFIVSNRFISTLLKIRDLDKNILPWMCPRVNTWAPQPLSMNIAPALAISILQIEVCNEGGGRVSFSTGRRNASQEPLAAVIGFYTWELRAAQNSIYRRRKKNIGSQKRQRAAEAKRGVSLSVVGWCDGWVMLNISDAARLGRIERHGFRLFSPSGDMHE